MKAPVIHYKGGRKWKGEPRDQVPTNKSEPVAVASERKKK